MARQFIPACFLAGLAASCGGEIEVPGVCDPGTPPSRASLRANETDPSDVGSTVLPNGRLLAGSQAKLGLGHPVDMVAHPSLPVVYVADARYFLDAAERCPTPSTMQRCGTNFTPTLSRRRGIHVLDVNGDTPKEIQDPSSICIEGTEALSGRTCPDGNLPNDGAYGLAITSDGTALFASTGLSGYVLRFSIDPTAGTLRLTHAIPVEGFTAGLALAPGEKTLFVVRFLGAGAATPSSIAEIALAPSIDEPKPMPMPTTPPTTTVPTPKLLDRNVDLQGFGAYGCVAQKEGDSGVRLWVSGFRAGPVQTVARDNPGEALKNLEVFDAGKNPEGIAPVDARTVAVAVSDSDYVVLLRHRAAAGDRPAGIESVGKIPVGHYGDEPYIGASPSQIIVDGARAYVTLASDNAMSVVDLDKQLEVGAVSVGQDPSAIAMAKTTSGGRRLVVANGKSPYGPQCPPGSMTCTLPLETADPVSDLDACWSSMASVPARIGAEVCDGPTPTRPELAKQFYLDETHEEGTLTVLDLAQQSDAQVAAASALTKKRIHEPVGAYENPCGDKLFPIPTKTALTPIRHVILLVRENKTYDFLLGDLDDDVRNPRHGERSFAVDTIRAGKGWPAITPNLHALARRFTSFDNFYDDAEVSMQGHSWSTRAFVNDYLERIHLEENAKSAFFNFPFDEETALGGADPAYGSFFTHLLRNGVSFRIFGEIVGALGNVNDDFVINHLDFTLQGNDRSHSDLEKARHVVEELTADDGNNAPSFTYVLLPRDHTEGIEAGRPSPVSMIAENDLATGQLVAGISSNPTLWKSTVIFIVEDDSLQGYDHIDYHRSICLVVSPWANPGHNSSVHASYPALFHTIERILGIDSMNRFDAYAPILWDAFTGQPSAEAYAPFTERCARVPTDAKVPTCSTSMNDDRDDMEPVEIDERPDIDRAVFGAVTGSAFGTDIRTE